MYLAVAENFCITPQAVVTGSNPVRTVVGLEGQCFGALRNVDIDKDLGSLSGEVVDVIFLFAVNFYSETTVAIDAIVNRIRLNAYVGLKCFCTLG